MALRGQEAQRMKVGTIRTQWDPLAVVPFLWIFPNHLSFCFWDAEKSCIKKKGKERSQHCHLASTETHMLHISECSLRERKKKITSYKSATLRGFFVQLPSFSCLDLLTGVSIYNVALSHPISWPVWKIHSFIIHFTSWQHAPAENSTFTLSLWVSRQLQLT